MKGEISEEALLKYSELAAEKLGVDFAEGEDMYDFARCMRPNGTYYGTRGKCRQGSEAGPAEKKEGTGARGAREGAAAAKAAGKKGGELLKARAEGKKAALAASRTEGGNKISAKNARARLLKEELEKVKDKMRGASPDVQNRLLQEASKKAADRAAAGEGKTASKPTGEAKPKRKLATSQETKAAWQEAEKAMKSAKANYNKVKSETKGDKSPEARKRLIQAGTLLDRAERAAAKASEKLGAAMKRESYRAMTPEQKKEEREWRKNLKKYG